MTRLFAPLGEGQHPISPSTPKPLAANAPLTQTWFYIAIAYAVPVSVFQAFKGRPFRAKFLNNLGVGTLPGLAATAYGMYREERVIRYCLESEGIKPIRPPIWETTTEMTEDDLTIAGVSLGLTAAIFTRSFRSVAGWRRYASFATVGCLSSQMLLLPFFGSKWSSAAFNYLGPRIIQRQLYHTYADAFKRSKDAPPIPAINVQAAGPPGIWEITPTRPNLIDWAEAQFPGVAQENRAPYGSTLMVQQSMLPVRNYHWQGDENDARLWIQQYQGTINDFSEEAEYVWLEITKRENALSTEADSNEKDIKVMELRALEIAHHRLWQEISQLDWVVANLKKYIRQLEARKSGNVWLPRQERLSEPDLKAPLLSAALLWQHRNSLNQSQAVNIDGSPLTEAQVQDQKNAILGADRVLQEFDKRVGEAGRRGNTQFCEPKKDL